MTGAALAAALVLTGVAAWQTVRIVQRTPPGTPTTARVLARSFRPPAPGMLAESRVQVLVDLPGRGPVTLEVAHPPASLCAVHDGAILAMALTEGDPPTLACMPQIPLQRRRATLVALVLALGVAALSSLAFRILRPR